MENANFGKLTSMHFYGWKKGLKTGMYYLRTKAAVDAIKFTVQKEAQSAPKTEEKPASKVQATVAPASTTPKTEKPEPTTTASSSVGTPIYEARAKVLTKTASVSESQATVQPTPNTTSSSDDMFVDKNSDEYKAAQIACSLDDPDGCEMCSG